MAILSLSCICAKASSFFATACLTYHEKKFFKWTFSSLNMLNIIEKDCWRTFSWISPSIVSWLVDIWVISEFFLFICILCSDFSRPSSSWSCLFSSFSFRNSSSISFCKIFLKSERSSEYCSMVFFISLFSLTCWKSVKRKAAISSSRSVKDRRSSVYKKRTLRFA